MKESEKEKYEYTFDDLNESTQEAFFDADMGRTYKSKDLDALMDEAGENEFVVKIGC